MSRKVQPKNISPLIKGARYTMLLAGWFYGVNKKTLFAAIEKRQKPLREAANEADRKKKLKEEREKTIRDLVILFEAADLEPNPGWEDEI